MKIYFAGSVRGGRQDVGIYAEIIAMLRSYGSVLTEHLGDPNISSAGEDLPVKEIHERDMAWLMSADVLIAEVTTPSLGVGYEIAKAESAGKKVLCLYRLVPGKKISTMLEGNPNIAVREYSSTEELGPVFRDFLSDI
ncbi:MAG: nucleoside 2-deoxyribosyltransferase [Candidatus Liptonbacteria bacterium]